MVNLANDFTDADLRRVLRRALRTIAILTVLAAPIVWAAFGWRNVVLLIVGAAVSATGVWEWQRLLTVLIATMDVKPDNTANKPSTGLVLAMFFLRLVLAAAVLYVSLKCCNGSVYALLGGLALSLIALGFEAVRLLMQT
jgi:hypothetical protein